MCTGVGMQGVRKASAGQGTDFGQNMPTQAGVAEEQQNVASVFRNLLASQERRFMTQKVTWPGGWNQQGEGQ